MAVGEGPKEQTVLTRGEMQVEMRIMVPNTGLHGKITSITDDGVEIHFDGRKGPIEYEWGTADFLVREE